MRILCLLFLGSLLFAQETKEALPVIPDKIRTSIAIAQRNYFIAKAQYDSAAAELNKAYEDGAKACEKKKFNQNTIQCE
jgi:hypothetical protein